MVLAARSTHFPCKQASTRALTHTHSHTPLVPACSTHNEHRPVSVVTPAVPGWKPEDDPDEEDGDRKEGGAQQEEEQEGDPGEGKGEWGGGGEVVVHEGDGQGSLWRRRRGGGGQVKEEGIVAGEGEGGGGRQGKDMQGCSRAGRAAWRLMELLVIASCSCVSC